MLPGLNGFEVCKRIRAKNKTVKIIAITGYRSRENKKQILAAGANDFMLKPLEIKKLLSRIDRLLKGKLIGKI